MAWTAYSDSRSSAVAVRTRRSGEPIDAVPLYLGEVSGPVLVSSATEQDFLVAPVRGAQAYRVALSTSGTFPTVRALGTISGGLIDAVAANATQYLIVTSSAPGDVPLTARAALLDPSDATLADATTIGPLRPVSALTYPPVTAAGGDAQFLVAWGDGKAVRVSAAGTLLDATPIAFAGASIVQTAVPPAAVFTGGTYFVAWPWAGNIHLARIRQDGTPLDPNGPSGVSPTLARNVTVFGPAAGPSLRGFHDGRDIVVTWFGDDGSTQGLYGVRASVSTGSRLTLGDGPEFRLGAGDAALAYDRRGGLMVVPGQGGFELTVPAAGGAPVVASPPPRNLLSETGRQLCPAAASDGTGFLVAWIDTTATLVGQTIESDVLAIRVDAQGATKDASALKLGTATPYNRVAVAFSRGAYFVVWSGQNHVYARRVLPDGTAGSPAIIVATNFLSTSPREVAIGCDDTSCLIGWRYDVSQRDSDMTAAFLHPDNMQLDGYFSIASDGYRGLSIAVETARPLQERAFLIAWPSRERQLLRALRVRASDGAPGSAVTVGSLYADPNVAPTVPTVASAGTDFVVAYDVERDKGAMLVGIDGATGMPRPATFQALVPSGADFATVHFDGASYLVTYARSLVRRLDRTVDRAGMRLSRDLVAVDPTPSGFDITNDTVTTGIEDNIEAVIGTPGVASDGHGKSLIVYQVSDLGTLTTRLRSRVITNDWDGVVPAVDAGIDAGTAEAGAADGPVDAGVAEVPSARDDAAPDAPVDASAPEAPSARDGAAADAGPSDAGGGADRSPATNAAGGCGCFVSRPGGTSPVALGSLLVLALVRLRPRRRRDRS